MKVIKKEEGTTSIKTWRLTLWQRELQRKRESTKGYKRGTNEGEVKRMKHH